jgi:hypothetical protein
MSEKYNSMISVLKKTLEGTNGFVVVPVADEELVLCYRNTNDEIDDPECDELLQALAPGVFRRFTVQTGGENRFTWMRVSNIDSYDLRSSFKRDFEGLTDQDFEAIKVSLVFQKMKRDEAMENTERRMSI